MDCVIYWCQNWQALQSSCLVSDIQLQGRVIEREHFFTICCLKIHILFYVLYELVNESLQLKT